MKTYLCALFNSHTGHYSPPTIFDTKENAMNSFVGEVQRPDSELANIKDRLTVYVVGRYDHTSGRVTPYLMKKLLIKGSEIILNPISDSQKGE